MFNANKPNDADLPTTGQLIRSTVIALATAVVILVSFVLPSEYGIDPTGIGRALGLTHMGEIKQQLAAEAHADKPSAVAQTEQAIPEPPALTGDAAVTSDGGAPAASPEIPPTDVATADTSAAAPAKTDEVSFTLKPSQGTEYKLTMNEGARASFTWNVSGGVVNYDLHGTARSGSETSYRKGREVQTDSGELVAAFDGAHGWFWRNRGTQDVTITLKTSGDYGELKRVN
jgi:hypothetical protein